MSTAQVDVLPYGDEERWDAFAQSVPGATFFHCAGWRAVIERAFGHRTYYLRAQRRGQVTGILPLTHIRAPLFGSMLISNAFCVQGGPVGEDEASRQALLRRAVALREELGATHLEMRAVVADGGDWLTRSGLYARFHRHLHADPEQNFREVPAKERRMVQKACADSLRCEFGGDVDNFYGVYSESVRNLGTPVLAKKYFRIFAEVFKDSCEFAVVWQDQVPLSTVMCFYFRDRILPYYLGGTVAARRKRANCLLYWEVIRRGGQRGCRVLDFGRSKIGTGAYHFKRNWGFEVEPLDYQYNLAPGADLPDLTPLNPKYQLAIACWKHLPLVIANRLGPPIARGLA